MAPEDVAARAGARAERSGALVSVEVDDAQEALWKLTSWAREDGLRLEELEVHRPTVEDVFLELTGAGHE